MSNETVRIDHSRDQVVRLIIDRPEVLNALNAQVIDELTKAIREAKCRALVIEGAGDKAFVAGADIAQMANFTADEARLFSLAGIELTKVLEGSPFPTIAKVQGFALGGGCELALACDVVVASERAKFGQPEVGLGLIPGFGGTQRLLERVGRAVAMDMLLADRKLSGTEAYQLGLISRVVLADQLETEVEKVLAGILRGGPDAISQTKRLALASQQMPLEDGLHYEATAFGLRFANEEARQGTAAFLRKEKPRFSLG